MNTQTKDILRFRAWTHIHKTSSNETRKSAALFAQSAMVRRMLECEFEEGLNLYRSGELVHMLGFAGFGHFAMLILNTVYARAIAEQAYDIINELANYELIEDQQGWYHRLHNCTLESATVVLAKTIDDPEERAMTRLIIGRNHHQLIDSAWLDEVPDAFPQISYALCELMLSVEHNFSTVVHATLCGRPDIFLYYEPDPLFVKIIQRSEHPPQKVLLPFEGFYSEQTVAAAAGWHLEHNQAREALELCKSMRPLSNYADNAYLIGGIACLELKNPQGATDTLPKIMNPAIVDNLLLAIAQHHPDAISNDDILAGALRSNAEQAELFYGFLMILLQRKDLSSAKKACFAKQETFLDHPTIKPIMDTVIKGAS